METILITVKISGKDAMELRIPSYITGDEFLAILSEITGEKFPDNSKIQAEPIGRILENAQPLETDGVETGALLTIL